MRYSCCNGQRIDFVELSRPPVSLCVKCSALRVSTDRYMHRHAEPHTRTRDQLGENKQEDSWRPSRVMPPCQYSCPKTSNNVMLSCDVIWRDKVNMHRSTHLKIRKSGFSTPRLWPLTLSPWPSNSSEIFSMSTSPSVCQTVWLGERWLTDTLAHTHRPDRFYTFDRWCGREKGQRNDVIISSIKKHVFTSNQRECGRFMEQLW